MINIVKLSALLSVCCALGLAAWLADAYQERAEEFRRTMRIGTSHITRQSLDYSYGDRLKTNAKICAGMALCTLIAFLVLLGVL